MTNNAQAFATIDAMIDALRATPAAVRRAPKELVPVVQKFVQGAATAGHGLDGAAWAPRVKDGQRALQNIMKYVKVTAEGAIVWVRLRGGPVFAQFGTHREVKRPLLPTSGLPDKLGNAIRAGLVDMGLPFMARKGGHNKATKGIKWDASWKGGA
jgi:hypothetical protein